MIGQTDTGLSRETRARIDDLRLRWETIFRVEIRRIEIARVDSGSGDRRVENHLWTSSEIAAVEITEYPLAPYVWRSKSAIAGINRLRTFKQEDGRSGT
jgi:hypothetical protein